MIVSISLPSGRAASPLSRPSRYAGLTVAALAAMGLAPAAQAGLIGTLTAGPAYVVTADSTGRQLGDGPFQPFVNAPAPNSLVGGASAGRGVGVGTAEYAFAAGNFLGMRGLVAAPTGSYLLGTLGGTSTGYGSSSAQGVDDSGTVIGSSDLWTTDGTQDLGGRAAWYAPGDATAHALPLPANFTDTTGHGTAGASGVARNGVIIGYGNLYNGDTSLGQRALRWSNVSSTPDVLQPLPGVSSFGDTRTAAIALNAAGTVVGAGDLYDASGNHLGLAALRWEAGSTKATQLDHIGAADDGTFACKAYGVNADGTTVGNCAKFDATGNFLADVAVRWHAKSTRAAELEGLGLSRVGFNATYALGINDAGVVFGVGAQYTPAGDYMGERAVRWAPNSTKPLLLKPLSLGLSGQTYEYANGINRKGWIAGSANFVLNNINYWRDPVALTVHAVVWGPDGSIHDLNQLLPAGSPWKLYSANAISDSGLVTGLAWYLPPAGDLTQPYVRLFTMQLTKTGATE